MKYYLMDIDKFLRLCLGLVQKITWLLEKLLVKKVLLQKSQDFGNIFICMCLHIKNLKK